MNHIYFYKKKLLKGTTIFQSKKCFNIVFSQFFWGVIFKIKLYL